VADRREARERTVEQLSGRASGHVRDEPDAAGIAFASGVVEEAVLVVHSGSPFGSLEEPRSLPPVLVS
jgi:hypothetical protein